MDLFLAWLSCLTFVSVDMQNLVHNLITRHWLQIHAELIITEKHHCLTLKIMQELYAQGMIKDLHMTKDMVERIFPMFGRSSWNPFNIPPWVTIFIRKNKLWKNLLNYMRNMRKTWKAYSCYDDVCIILLFSPTQESYGNANPPALWSTI